MKIIVKNILTFQEALFFTPLRDKVDYARLLTYSARNLLLDYVVGKSPVCGYMKLVIDKMSRLFFYDENHIFSVSFPFTVFIGKNKVIEIASYSGREIDLKSISDMISILENDKFKLNHSLLDYFIDSEDYLDHETFLLLEEILQFEPTYIRYDNDPGKENGRLHPLHHLDINYSSYGTYKFGLGNAVVEGYLEDMLNIETECSYIK